MWGSSAAVRGENGGDTWHPPTHSTLSCVGDSLDKGHLPLVLPHKKTVPCKHQSWDTWTGGNQPVAVLLACWDSD